jgi:phosphoribosylamine--glycine ligase
LGNNVLVADSGGRGHVLASEYAYSHNVDMVYLAPGTPGINYTRQGQKGHIIQVPEVKVKKDVNLERIIKFCQEHDVGLVDIGPEGYLSRGFVDVLTDHGIPCIGPKQAYTRLESDRAFTDELLAQIGVSKPEWRVFDDPNDARDYVKNIGYQVVVKANGLASGKGAIVCDDVDDALNAIDKIMVKKEFGDSGDKAVIEARKYGQEISFYAYLDGQHAFPLRLFAKDYKPACDPDDQETIERLGGNLNTGGTGCYSPHELAKPWMVNRIIREVVNPTVNQIYNGFGWNYKGVMYFGLNLDPYNNLDVFEINVRHGDPEAEVLLRSLKTDPWELAMAVWQGKLDEVEQRWNDRYYVDVVAMTGKSRREDGKGWYPGYPKSYGKGYQILGLDDLDRSVAVFFAGVDEHPERGLVTSGGRVLHVVGGDETLEDARELAYDNIRRLRFLDHENEGENILRFRETIAAPNQEH